jgi:hypothetical protein
MNRTYLILIAIFATVAVLVSIGGYYVYQITLQPNIQVTTVSVYPPVTHPLTINLLNEERVSDIGSFNYVPVNKSGEYVLVFSNDPSSSSDRFVNLTYTTHWPDYLWAFFTLDPGESRTVQVHVNSGQQLGGDFWVTGESGSDVNFQIVGYTCTEDVSFSFFLIDRGSVDGYADVAFTVDGVSAWTGKYFVPLGSSVPVNGSVTIENCAIHAFNVVVEKQYKP